MKGRVKVHQSIISISALGCTALFFEGAQAETCTCVTSTLHIPYAMCTPRSCMCRSVDVCIVKLGVYIADEVCMIKKRVCTPGGVLRAAAGLCTPQF